MLLEQRYLRPLKNLIQCMEERTDLDTRSGFQLSLLDSTPSGFQLALLNSIQYLEELTSSNDFMRQTQIIDEFIKSQTIVSTKILICS